MRTNRITGCLLVVLSAFAFAEAPTGLKGTVTDQTVAVIPGAKIIIRYHDLCRDSNEPIPDRSVTANEAGGFVVNLRSGFYDVIVMADGFEPGAETVRILPGEQLAFSRKLKISSYSNLRCDRMAEPVSIPTTTSEAPEPPERKKK